MGVDKNLAIQVPWLKSLIGSILFIVLVILFVDRQKIWQRRHSDCCKTHESEVKKQQDGISLLNSAEW